VSPISIAQIATAKASAGCRAPAAAAAPPANKASAPGMGNPIASISSAANKLV
jgi:hypothetical protein